MSNQKISTEATDVENREPSRVGLTDLQRWIGSDLQRENWDSYGAAVVETRTIIVAMKVAECIAGLVFEGRPIDRVDPCNNGDIAFSDGDESIWIRVSTIAPEEVS